MLRLEIVRGRGVVTALNRHTPVPDDPRYPWHGCAQRSLEADGRQPSAWK